MDKLSIKGGRPLEGTVQISGAKNAALPLMAATLLTHEPLILHRVPHLADISSLANLLGQHGTTIAMEESGEDGHTGHILRLHTPEITSHTAPYDLVRKMRASVLVLGPLLARAGQARVSLPGGCAIGARPIDQHLKALEAMGAVITLQDGYIEASAPNGLEGAEIQFDMVSVGATENLLMAASLAKGTTVLHNAAREPEVADLARCLVAMGAKIDGIGRGTVEITGVGQLHGAEHGVVPDRIEAGSYLLAFAITGGHGRLVGARPENLSALLEKLHEAGLTCTVEGDDIVIPKLDGRLNGVNVMTQPHPGFPTDMQAQLMAALCLADGASVITETIFENRFMHVPELVRMGADISLHGNVATIKGVPRFKGAPVMATDLRASMSLVLAGLAAEGETIINRIYHLDRGYERLEEKLSMIGADVKRVA